MIQLLFGENEFAIGAEKARRRAVYLKSHDALGLESIDGAAVEASRLRDAVLQLPFLVDSKLVIIHGIFGNKQACETLTGLISDIPESIDVLFIDPKPDKRTKLFKQLQKNKQTQEFFVLKGTSLTNWMVGYAKDQGTILSASDAQYLIDKAGTDQMLLAREIEKLCYEETINRSSIDELVEPSLHASVFDLLDHTFAGHTKQALDMYQTLLVNKTDPSEIIGLIAWQLHVLALVKYAGAQSADGIARVTGIHPFVINKSLRIAQRLSTVELKAIVARTLEIDTGIKTGKFDGDDALRVLLLELSTA
jgi:DNA polymerase III subunit delta